MGYDPEYRRKARSLAHQKAEKIIKQLNDSCEIAMKESNSHIYSSEFVRQIDIEGVRVENAIAGIYWEYSPSKGMRVRYYFGERRKGGKPVVQVCDEWELKELIYAFLKPEQGN
ncbi:hypothetical protein [Pseudoalteromonas sp. MelDa3]|uniref:hypothetical protein n=1 Tax=Pseudoalteromonas sp. MelDa3 TaxID=888435 RepID=UPI000CB56598|nr:hypothetical protein [Pseudoalteromonas sp. MelDa3]PLT23516.1 hypothetical protein CXF89_19265 [Pseudoalteromonas sp. MelDa3]